MIFRKRDADPATKGTTFRLPHEIADVLEAALLAHDAWMHLPAIGPDGNVTAAYARLYPRAYLDPTEDKAEALWQSERHGALAAGKAASLERVRSALLHATPGRSGRTITVDASGVQEWCMVINDVRIRLGAELDIQNEQQFADADPSHPQWESIVQYHVLSHVLDQLVDASI